MSKLKLGIKKEPTPDTVPIEALKPGDVFHHRTDVYMVVVSDTTLLITDIYGRYHPDTHVMALCLKSFRFAHWSNGVHVTPVESASMEVQL